MKKLIVLISFGLLFFGCKDELIVDPPPKAAKGVYVINEGSFSQNNASITFYNNETGEAVQNVYSAANNNAPLGDNANSMFIFGNKGYIAVDNSNKIEIIDLNNFKSLGIVDFGSGGSPREIFIKDSTAGYATSLYGNQVVKFNPSTKQVEKRIDVGSNPEGLAESNGKLFAANSGFGASQTITVIDMENDAVIKTINVGLNPRVILKNNSGNIFVICTGSYTDTTLFSGVYIIDAVSNSVIDSIAVPKNPGEACWFDGSKLLVVNSDGVVQVDLTAKSVSPFISGSAVNSSFGIIYSISYDAVSGNIYCGNPKDFQQNGEVVLFDKSGSEKKRFNTGINPGTIAVRY